MEKDNFLDTNIIFSYSNYTPQSSELIKKCYALIKNKQGRFIVCGAVLEELSEIIAKRARIHKAVINKIKDSDFSLDNTQLVSKRDIPRAKQLYEKFKGYKEEEATDHFRQERRLSEIAIQKFLSALIDEKAIPLEQIQTELVNKIHDILSNHADCKIVASALQLQKERKIFLFVTADKQDLAPNHYEFLKEHFEINHPRDKYIFPELCNLMFTK